MPTSTDVTTLKINTLTKAQYETAVQGGVIGANEISILTDVDEAIQVDTMPAAAAGEVGKVYQFIGTTDANYTHGYFYECVSDGQPTPTYSWSQVNVQPAPSGLPDQTGQSGKFLTTNGTDASWTDTMTTWVGFYDGSYERWRVGQNGHDVFTIQVSPSASSTRRWGALTFNARVVPTMSTGTPKIDVQAPAGWQSTFGWNGNGWKTVVTRNISSSNSGYDDDYLISVPTVTAGAMSVQVSTMPTAGNTYLGRVYQYIGTTDANYTHGYIYECVSDGGDPATYSWTAINVQAGGGSTGTTGTLVAADWSSSSQTINVTGVTASNNVIVAAAPASQADYTAAGVICTAQGAGTLTFTCTSTPSTDLTVNVLII